jgi:alkylation response protein AidB-like acyl-CoA dehydrogenase
VYDRDDVDAEPRATIDGSRALAEIVRVTGSGRLLTDDLGVVAKAWHRGVLGTSALLVGLARRMLDLTVAYVKQREQYGVAVGSFQAIKHSLASAHLAVEFARPMVLAAAWELSTGGGGDQVCAAKVLASDAARLVARTAIQCHGAMGYTTEYDLHLFAKRVWALAPSWGDAASHRARLAEALGV